MARIDHHIKPYDEGTLVKLEIFERYVETWLPTFIMQPHVKEVNIVDFFAGLGYDKLKQKGSPIRILDKIDSFYGYLQQYNTKINLYLNEFKQSKYTALQENCNEYLSNNSKLNKFVEIHYSNKDFNEIYTDILNKTKNAPNLYIIDQSGIKFTNQKNFDTLLKTTKTDFLFFISSSFFKRFNTTEEFNRHLDITEEELNKNPYNFIHRTVLEKYRSLIPVNSTMQIFPFSIRKGANIYGIIFGSKHILGVEKFLKIAWNKNKINGEANFDIDKDIIKAQPTLFPEMKQFTKIEKFENILEEFMANKKTVTNIDLYYFTYQNGHIAEHTNKWLRKSKKNKLISFKGHPKTTWKSVNNNEIVVFKWLK